MAVTRAILYRPRLRVELEDIQEDLPAVQFNSTFELNSIPAGPRRSTRSAMPCLNGAGVSRSISRWIWVVSAPPPWRCAR
jgi:hypothetical protein